MRIRSLALIDDSIHKKKMDIQVKTDLERLKDYK